MRSLPVPVQMSITFLQRHEEPLSSPSTQCFFSRNCQGDLEANQNQSLEVSVCFYWLAHCPADISHVENVLNIMALLSPPSKKDGWSKPQTALGGCYLSECHSVGGWECSAEPLRVGPDSRGRLTGWLSTTLSHRGN